MVRDLGRILPAEREPRGICHLCLHKHWGRSTCNAFPRGIPDRFLRGEAKHLSAVEGDDGVVFNPMIGVTVEDARKHP